MSVFAQQKERDFCLIFKMSKHS